MTWRRVRDESEHALRRAGVPDPSADARRIVESASGHGPSDLLLALDDPAPALGVAASSRMTTRRAAGEPLQYVLGAWGFRGLDLFVDRRVLIPRPETEVVVGRALEEIDRLGGGDLPTVRVVDLGTGSGAMALSIAAERPRTRVWATDISEECLAVARSNLAGLGRPAQRVRLLAGDLFAALPDDLRGAVDLVVSNPPYVARGEDLPTEVADWEPSTALVAGESGTEVVEAILAEARHWLRPAGGLVVEFAPHQAEAMAARAIEMGYRDVDVFVDLAGRERGLRAVVR